MNQELPTIAAELERKSVDHFERVVRAFEQGKITKAQLASSIQAIFQVVSGLVPEAIILALESADPERDGTFDTKRVFWKRLTGEVFSICRHSQGERLTIVKMRQGVAIPTVINKEFPEAIIPAKKAAAAMDLLVNGVINDGYQEV
jgi:hypothetical protein